MELTTPLFVDELRLAYPRDMRGMEDSEVEALLRIEERVIRSQYGVSSTSAAVDVVLGDAMLAAWPSFLQQIRQLASEDVSTDGYSATYHRVGGVDFAFPVFVGAILADVADPESVLSAPSTTQLVR